MFWHIFDNLKLYIAEFPFSGLFHSVFHFLIYYKSSLPLKFPADFHLLSILAIANLYGCGHWGGQSCEFYRLPRVSNKGYCCFCFWSVQSDTCLFLLTADPDGFFQLKECRYFQNPPCSFEAHRSLQAFLGVNSSVIEVSMFVLFLRKGSLCELRA